MYETDLQMRLRDLNTAHHVDNLEVMRVADEARILFLGGAEGVRDEPLGVLKNMPSEVMILVAAQHAEFRAQIRWQPGASYRVRSWVGHVGTSSFTVESEIRTERSEPDAVIEATVVLLDQRTGRPWPFSGAVRRELERHRESPLTLRPRPGSAV
ncbi:MAG: hypothetical protein IPL94_04675 [Tetrasphaera sp.]|nr:hypothetical protein [Tetrasphaera sp.]